MSGISGDMFLGALIDMGAKTDKLFRLASFLEKNVEDCSQVKLDVQEVERKGFKARRVEVSIKEKESRDSGELLEIASKSLKYLNLPGRARTITMKTLETIVKAEEVIHAGNGELHELGSLDTVIDVVGAVNCLNELNLLENTVIYSTIPPVGGGTIKFSHGETICPTSVTMQILRQGGIPFKGGPIEAELTTPTGAALLANLVQEFIKYYPQMKVKSLGYGAGEKDFKEIPNILRLVLGREACTIKGQITEQKKQGKTGSFDSFFSMDNVAVLETSLDDVTGETLGYLLEKLLRQGAKDVNIIPMYTKKNRPGNIIKIICSEELAEKLVETLMKETGTLGVRVQTCKRYIASRKILTVETKEKGKKFRARAKVSFNNKGEIMNIKPEYDDTLKIAMETGEALRVIQERVKLEARKKMRQEKERLCSLCNPYKTDGKLITAF